MKMLDNYGPNTKKARTIALVLKAVIGFAATSTLITGHVWATLVIGAVGAGLNELINIKNWNDEDQH